MVWSDRNFSGFVDFIEALKRKKTCSIILPHQWRLEWGPTLCWCSYQLILERDARCVPDSTKSETQQSKRMEKKDFMWSEGADDDISRDYHVFKPNINLHSTNQGKKNSPIYFQNTHHTYDRVILKCSLGCSWETGVCRHRKDRNNELSFLCFSTTHSNSAAVMMCFLWKDVARNFGPLDFEPLWC
jgi:hypothetical protein